MSLYLGSTDERASICVVSSELVHGCKYGEESAQEMLSRSNFSVYEVPVGLEGSPKSKT